MLIFNKYSSDCFFFILLLAMDVTDRKFRQVRITLSKSNYLINTLIPGFYLIFGKLINRTIRQSISAIKTFNISKS